MLSKLLNEIYYIKKTTRKREEPLAKEAMSLLARLRENQKYSLERGNKPHGRQ